MISHAPPFSDVEELGDVSAEYFVGAIPSEQFVGFVALSGDDIVGSAGLSTYEMPPKPLRHDGRFGYISSMYVLPDHRRQGLGTQLLAAIMAHAESIGLTWMTLHVSPMGRPIYEAAGFESWDEMALHLPSAPVKNTGMSSD